MPVNFSKANWFREFTDHCRLDLAKSFTYISVWTSHGATSVASLTWDCLFDDLELGVAHELILDGEHEFHYTSRVAI